MEDLRAQIPTKFSLGRFNTGTNTIFGIVFKSVLYGWIIKTNLTNQKKFQFLKLNEFEMDEKYPRFRKRLGRWKKYRLRNNSRKAVKYILSFLDEVVNLPQYSLQYPEILQGSERKVLFEKSSLKTQALNYSKLNSGYEWYLTHAIASKYGKDLIKGVHLVKPVYTYDFWDLYSYNCVVQLPSFHAKELYITIHTYEPMAVWYDYFAKDFRQKSGVEKELEEIKEKNQ